MKQILEASKRALVLLLTGAMIATSVPSTAFAAADDADDVIIEEAEDAVEALAADDSAIEEEPRTDADPVTPDDAWKDVKVTINGVANLKIYDSQSGDLILDGAGTATVDWDHKLDYALDLKPDVGYRLDDAVSATTAKPYATVSYTNGTTGQEADVTSDVGGANSFNYVAGTLTLKGIAGKDYGWTLDTTKGVLGCAVSNVALGTGASTGVQGSVTVTASPVVADVVDVTYYEGTGTTALGTNYTAATTDKALKEAEYGKTFTANLWTLAKLQTNPITYVTLESTGTEVEIGTSDYSFAVDTTAKTAMLTVSQTVIDALMAENEGLVVHLFDELNRTDKTTVTVWDSALNSWSYGGKINDETTGSKYIVWGGATVARAPFSTGYNFNVTPKAAYTGDGRTAGRTVSEVEYTISYNDGKTTTGELTVNASGTYTIPATAIKTTTTGITIDVETSENIRWDYDSSKVTVTPGKDLFIDKTESLAAYKFNIQTKDPSIKVKTGGVSYKVGSGGYTTAGLSTTNGITYTIAANNITDSLTVKIVTDDAEKDTIVKTASDYTDVVVKDQGTGTVLGKTSSAAVAKSGSDYYFSVVPADGKVVKSVKWAQGTGTPADADKVAGEDDLYKIRSAVLTSSADVTITVATLETYSIVESTNEEATLTLTDSDGKTLETGSTVAVGNNINIKLTKDTLDPDVKWIGYQVGEATPVTLLESDTTIANNTTITLGYSEIEGIQAGSVVKFLVETEEDETGNYESVQTAITGTTTGRTHTVTIASSKSDQLWATTSTNADTETLFLAVDETVTLTPTVVYVNSITGKTTGETSTEFQKVEWAISGGTDFEVKEDTGIVTAKAAGTSNSLNVNAYVMDADNSGVVYEIAKSATVTERHGDYNLIKYGTRNLPVHILAKNAVYTVDVSAESSLDAEAEAIAKGASVDVTATVLNNLTGKYVSAADVVWEETNNISGITLNASKGTTVTVSASDNATGTAVIQATYTDKTDSDRNDNDTVSLAVITAAKYAVVPTINVGSVGAESTFGDVVVLEGKGVSGASQQSAVISYQIYSLGENISASDLTDKETIDKLLTKGAAETATGSDLTDGIATVASNAGSTADYVVKEEDGDIVYTASTDTAVSSYISGARSAAAVNFDTLTLSTSGAATAFSTLGVDSIAATVTQTVKINNTKYVNTIPVSVVGKLNLHKVILNYADGDNSTVLNRTAYMSGKTSSFVLDDYTTEGAPVEKGTVFTAIPEGSEFVLPAVGNYTSPEATRMIKYWTVKTGTGDDAVTTYKTPGNIIIVGDEDVEATATWVDKVRIDKIYRVQDDPEDTSVGLGTTFVDGAFTLGAVIKKSNIGYGVEEDDDVDGILTFSSTADNAGATPKTGNIELSGLATDTGNYGDFYGIAERELTAVAGTGTDGIKIKAEYVNYSLIDPSNYSVGTTDMTGKYTFTTGAYSAASGTAVASTDYFEKGSTYELEDTLVITGNKPVYSVAFDLGTEGKIEVGETQTITATVRDENTDSVVDISNGTVTWTTSNGSSSAVLTVDTTAEGITTTLTGTTASTGANDKAKVNFRYEDIDGVFVTGSYDVEVAAQAVQFNSNSTSTLSADSYTTGTYKVSSDDNEFYVTAKKVSDGSVLTGGSWSYSVETDDAEEIIASTGAVKFSGADATKKVTVTTGPAMSDGVTLRLIYTAATGKIYTKDVTVKNAYVLTIDPEDVVGYDAGTDGNVVKDAIGITNASWTSPSIATVARDDADYNNNAFTLTDTDGTYITYKNGKYTIKNTDDLTITITTASHYSFDNDTSRVDNSSTAIDTARKGWYLESDESKALLAKTETTITTAEPNDTLYPYFGECDITSITATTGTDEDDVIYVNNQDLATTAKLTIKETGNGNFTTTVTGTFDDDPNAISSGYFGLDTVEATAKSTPYTTPAAAFSFNTAASSGVRNETPYYFAAQATKVGSTNLVFTAGTGNAAIEKTFVVMAAGWEPTSKKYYDKLVTTDSDGKRTVSFGIVKNDNRTVDGEVVYLDASGNIDATKTGLSGAIPTLVYYENGVAMTDQIKSVDGKYYYFGTDGYAVYDTAFTFEGATYYADENGHLVKGFYKDATTEKLYYYDETDFKKKTVMPDQIVTIDGKKYYMLTTGEIVTTGIYQPNSALEAAYYCDPTTGAITESGWVTFDDINTYYAGESSLLYNGIKTVEGKKMYFKNYAAQYGTSETDLTLVNEKYYISKTGEVAIGGIFTLGGVQRLFREDGSLVSFSDATVIKESEDATEGTITVGSSEYIIKKADNSAEEAELFVVSTKVWTWTPETGIPTAAKVVFTSTTGKTKEFTVEVADMTVTTDATTGYTTYEASASFVSMGQTISDKASKTFDEQGNEITHDHVWVFDGFKWADNNKSATATFTCSVDADKPETKDALVVMTDATEGEGTSAITTYTATVSIDPSGKTLATPYIEYKRFDAEGNLIEHDHVWGEPTWKVTVASGVVSGTATFTCTPADPKEKSHDQSVAITATPTDDGSFKIYTITAKDPAGKEYTYAQKVTVDADGNEVKGEAKTWTATYTTSGLGTTTPSVTITFTGDNGAVDKVTVTPEAKVNGDVTTYSIAVKDRANKTHKMSWDYNTKTSEETPGTEKTSGTDASVETGEISVAFVIDPETDTDGNPVFTFTGAAIKPAVIVRDEDRDVTLAQSVDYSLTYSKTTKVGDPATIIVNGKGNYAGKSVTLPFKVVAFSQVTDGFAVKKIKSFGTFTDGTETGVSTVTYNGNTWTPEQITVTDASGADVVLKLQSDGTYANEDGTKTTAISIANNVNKGSATVSALKANGSVVKKTFKINAVDFTAVSSGDLTFDPDDAVWAAKGAVPANLNVEYKGMELVLGQDYTVKYTYTTKTKDAGDKAGKFTITGKGNFTKKFATEQTFDIKPLELDENAVSVAVYDKVKVSAVKPTVSDGNGVAIAAKSLSVTVVKEGESSPLAASTKLAAGDKITVTVKGANESNISGSVDIDVTVAANLAKAKVTLPKGFTKYYTGEPVELTEEDFASGKIAVTINKTTTLKYGEDFEIAGYQNNLKKGNMTVILRGTSEKCSGTKTFKVKITAKTMKKAD